MYLIDTDVLSLLRRPDRASVGLERPSDPRFGAILDPWLATIATRYADRVLPFGTRKAVLWADLCAAVGYVSVDLMIAATAKARGLTVVTRNLRHYAGTGRGAARPGGRGIRSSGEPDPHSCSQQFRRHRAIPAGDASGAASA